MKKAIRDNHGRYEWVVLAMAWLTIVAIYWAWNLIPSIAYQLMPALGLSETQFMLIYASPMLASAIIALPGGSLGDKYGIRPIVGVAGFIGAAAGLARAFTPNFATMLIMMLLVGVAMGLAVSNLPKTVRTWFPLQRIGIASGIYVTGMGIGLTLGLITGPLFGNWQEAFLITGIIGFVIAICWTVFARSSPPGVKIDHPNISSGLRVSLRSRNVWLGGVSYFFLNAAFTIFGGNFPKALDNIHNIGPVSASFIASLYTIGLTVGNIIGPLLSARAGLRKPFLSGSAILGGIVLYFAWALAPAPAIRILAFIGGLILGFVPPLVYALPAELPEIGHAYVGGAGGMVNGLGSLGGFFLPLAVSSYVLVSETSTAYTLGFIMSAVLFICAAIPIFFVIETGFKARKLRGELPQA